jgi:hypothetical protein
VGASSFSTIKLAIWGTEVAWIAAWTQQACFSLGLTPREVTPLFQIAHFKARGNLGRQQDGPCCSAAKLSR